MALSFIGYEYAEFNTATLDDPASFSQTVAIPSGVQSGDTIVIVSTTAWGLPITPPAGFSIIPPSGSSWGFQSTFSIYTKVLTEAETGTYTFGYGQYNLYSILVCFAVRGIVNTCEISPPIDSSNSITVSQPSLLVNIFWHDSSFFEAPIAYPPDATLPSELTEQWAVTTRNTYHLAGQRFSLLNIAGTVDLIVGSNSISAGTINTDYAYSPTTTPSDHKTGLAMVFISNPVFSSDEKIFAYGMTAGLGRGWA